MTDTTDIPQLDTVDTVLDGLSDATLLEVYRTLLPFDGDMIAAATARRALSGGGGGGIFALSRRAILFTETTGDGIYVGSVTVPSGTSILDVAVFCLAGPWNAASAQLQVGDVADDEGYMVGVDLVNALVDPYLAADAETNHGTAWTNPFVAGGAYGHAANWYAAGNAVYTPTVRYPAGETITARLVAAGYGGPITAISPGFGGSGYAPGDTGTIDGGNDDATYVVDTVDGGGAVLTLTLTAPGTGYTQGPGKSTTPTSGIGTFLEIDVDDVDVAPIGDPGIVVVDVIGFGVPGGAIDAVKAT